jgi:hypothetical protein
MFRSASSAGAAQFVIIGDTQSERVELFNRALARQGLKPGNVISYLDFIAGRVSLRQQVPDGAVIRIESPGDSFEVERAILALGAAVDDEEGSYARASAGNIAALVFDKGAILYPRQWYLGYRELLRRIEEQLDSCPPHKLMSRPQAIATMFDKPCCHALLASGAVPVPRNLAPVRSYDELMARMSEAGCYSVFVKLAHGSSASGVMAYRVSGGRHQATTTVEMVSGPGGLRLYNSKRLRVYTTQSEVAALVDALCRHRVHVEQWVPKAGIGGKALDLRVLVVAGEARHVVVRLNSGTVTNLHLATTRTGGRMSLDALMPRLDASVWDEARRSCERVLELFPGTLYAGIDLLITSDFKRHAVAEVNAFGDLLYGAVHQGLDPYETEIVAALGREAAVA